MSVGAPPADGFGDDGLGDGPGGGDDRGGPGGVAARAVSTWN